MNDSWNPSAIERFRSVIESRFGLLFDETKEVFLEEVLRRRVQATGGRVEDYLKKFESPGVSDGESRVLIEALTVSETYCFRHIEQFRAFAEVALKARWQGPSMGQKIRILSAGCASGEEAYSLAILLREQHPDLSPGDVFIRGVDINPLMIEKANRARYSAWSLRETPDPIKGRWFRQEGREFVLDDTIRTMVSFERRNLIQFNDVWQPETMDIVFCRNVIMYLTPEHAQALVARIAQTLRPGGFLFLGYAETLRGLSQDFHLCHTHDTFYYQRHDALAHMGAASAFDGKSPATKQMVAQQLEVFSVETSWIDAIRRAADRIQVLTQPPAVRSAGSPAAWDLTPTLELLRNERFSEALAHLGTLPTESADSTEVMLLRASLLTHSGDFVEAEKACVDLLAVDELSAGAHYLMALCRERVGDLQAATDHDQVAVYLDPYFAMPRLHLGLMARRVKNQQAAQRELRQAVTLLQREDPSRIMLFGGGFSRETLMALCRAELVAGGGLP